MPGKASGYRRNRTTGTNLVSSLSGPPIRETISPKLNTSFFDQCCRGALWNRRLILARWFHSLSLLSFSNLLFFACFSLCLSLVFFPGLGPPVDWRITGCWFKTASLASSSSATARPDPDQLTASDQSEERKHLRFERAAPVVSLSFDPSAAWMGVGAARRIAPSRPFR